MFKIVSLFNSKKRSASTEQASIAQIEKEFPTLTPQEEQEVFNALGVQPKQDEHAKDVIMGTLRRLKMTPSGRSSSQTKLDFSASEKSDESSNPASPRPEEEEGYVDVGTVRVKDWDGQEMMGTVRVKEGNPWGTISVNNPAWMGSSTIRIAHDDVEKALEDGEVQVNSPETKSEEPQFMAAFREPEEWELSILALEKGEWIPEMDKNAEAFRKYKKERKPMNNLFNQSLRKRGIGVTLTATPSSQAAASTKDEAPETAAAASPTTLQKLMDRKSSGSKKEKKKELKDLEKALKEMQ